MKEKSGICYLGKGFAMNGQYESLRWTGIGLKVYWHWQFRDPVIASIGTYCLVPHQGVYSILLGMQI